MLVRCLTAPVFVIALLSQEISMTTEFQSGAPSMTATERCLGPPAEFTLVNGVYRPKIVMLVRLSA